MTIESFKRKRRAPHRDDSHGKCLSKRSPLLLEMHYLANCKVVRAVCQQSLRVRVVQVSPVFEPMALPFLPCPGLLSQAEAMLAAEPRGCPLPPASAGPHSPTGSTATLTRLRPADGSAARMASERLSWSGALTRNLPGCTSTAPGIDLATSSAPAPDSSASAE
jgi:hypothetical protein